MKKEWIIFSILFFSASHYFHYQWNQMNQFFYNTVFSLPQTPHRFYNVNLGESKTDVESRIGKPLSQEGSRFYYSKQASILEPNWVWFSVDYDRDTVVSKSVFFDD